MVGSKERKTSQATLKQFWLKLADADIDLDKTTLHLSSDSIFQLIEQFMPSKSLL